MNNYLKASLDAFNVSKNCDRASAQSFYDSYVERKKKIVSGKLEALKRGSPINQKKLQWEVMCLRGVRDDKVTVLRYVGDLIRRTSFDPNNSILREAEELIHEN